MRAAQVIFLVLLHLFSFLFSFSGDAFAAAKETIPAPGKFLQGAAVPLEEAKTKCIVDPDKEAHVKGDCSVLKLEQLGAIKEERHYLAWYRRAGADAPLEQLVLFSAEREGAPLKPVWTDIVDASGSPGPITEAALRHGPLGDFLELKYSTGGTAGTWTEYFLRKGSGWTYLQQLQVEEDAVKCMPKGYGILTKNIDLENSTVEVFAPNADDPNCCPSGRIYLKLKLVGDSLRGEQCRFQKK